MPRPFLKLFPAVSGLFTFLARTFEGKSTGEFLSEPALRRRKKIARYTYNFLFALLTAVLFALPGPRSSLSGRFEPGDIAEQTLVSPLSVEIDSEDAPALRKRALTRKFPPVYDYDESIHDKWQKDWQAAFKNIREKYYSGRKQQKASPELVTGLREAVYDFTEQTLLPEQIEALHRQKFSTSTEKNFLRHADRLAGRLISASDLFASHSATGVVIRYIGGSSKEVIVHDLAKIWSLEQAQEYLTASLGSVRDGKTAQGREIAEIVASLIPPTVQFNATLTQKRLDSVLAAERPNRTRIHAGQVLVRRGEKISEAQADTIERLQTVLGPKSMSKRALYAFVIVLVFVSVLFRTNYLGRGFWHLSLKDCVFFLVVSLFTLAAAKYSLPYFKILLASLSIVEGVAYLLPLSAGGIIIHLMMGKEAGHAFALFVSITVALLIEQNLFFALWTYVVTAAAIQSIKSCKQRTDLYKCGFTSGILGAVLVIAFSLVQSSGLKSIAWDVVGSSAVLALASGFFSSTLTSVLIPLVESVAGYTTSLKLLELSNFNHPLLHSLMMKAPGTYHHSVIVGSLAELAADRINANGLLARVSAYYHDIGKMGKPLYFIENQTPGQNPHDGLTPAMSAKILFSHVKNGVRMGREYNLGKNITEIIEQHHGTTLVSYFFNKAKNAEDPNVDPATESDFRYPGPRPQTREAAIVMLADACEAATRSIAEPTPAKIQGMVRSIINRRFLEEQFNECDLTFHNLQVIEEHFVRTLVSLYHHRIEYPGQKKEIQNNTTPTASHSSTTSVKKGA